MHRVVEVAHEEERLALRLSRFSAAMMRRVSPTRGDGPVLSRRGGAGA